ncbi:MAG: hypothetical protein IJA74_02925 [Oscillospiraceae bacterium]|nr:hypothetical protein [Oscillospiraceae bacterium]
MLKKAAGKGLEIMGDTLEKSKQMKQAQQEKNAQEAQARRLAEEERLQQEQAAKEAEERAALEKALQPSCEQGDCLWYDNRFYFTCAEDCPCERKKYTKKDWGTDHVRPEFWPYLKRLEERQDNQPDTEKIVRDFMREFFPQYGEGNSLLAQTFIMSGLTDRNPFLPIFDTLKASPVPSGGSVVSALDWLYHTYHFDACFGGLGPVFENKIWTNISLYDRPLEDFKYTVKTIMTVLNEEKLREYSKDISGISIDQLYDADGRVKSAGCGGPQAGFYGDTIWNTVESWSGENGENDNN